MMKPVDTQPAQELEGRKRLGQRGPRRQAAVDASLFRDTAQYSH